MIRRIPDVAGSEPSVTVLDDLIQEIYRADSLVGVLAETLTKLGAQDDAPYQIYALSVMAEGTVDILQSILTKALTLHRRHELPAVSASEP
jgi:hypothetical protein